MIVFDFNSAISDSRIWCTCTCKGPADEVPPLQQALTDIPMQSKIITSRHYLTYDRTVVRQID